MPTFVIYCDAPHKLRADGCNVFVAAGADAAAARTRAEALLGVEAGGLGHFRTVEVTDATEPFVVQGHGPIGGRAQDRWPSLTRGGDRLPGAGT